MEATKYIGNFNSQHITLYAVWDSGITITAQADGNDGATQFIYMGTSGKYQVKLSDFDNMITTPSGYKHVGWTGGFLGDEIVARESYSISDQDIEWNNPDYFVITAVFKKILTVGYSIDGTYSNDWQRGETVVEGGTVANPNLHTNVSCKIDSYEFKGWYVKGDEAKTIVDLSTYKITENTTFVALFGATEEEST